MDDGYIFVYQDVRGRYFSEGTFRDMTPILERHDKPTDVDEGTDAYDTIDWLVKNLPTNGKVGIYGTSYPGFYTTASCLSRHPALVACSPQAPMTDIWMGDDNFHGGAFLLAHNFSFYTRFGAHPAAAARTRRIIPVLDGHAGRVSVLSRSRAARPGHAEGPRLGDGAPLAVDPHASERTTRSGRRATFVRIFTT